MGVGNVTLRNARHRRQAAVIATTIALVAAFAPSIALAGGRGATIVRGIQHEYGSCGLSNDGYLMTGSLDGCWWVDTFEVKPMPVQGTMLAHGTEHFTGWLGSRFGTFYTEYSYTARFDGAIELHGRCHHPIIGGIGDFVGIRGELSFTDVVDQEPFSYPYWGNIQLGGDGTTTLARTAVTATLASATVASAASGPC
jgi:hypothetical protein